MSPPIPARLAGRPTVGGLVVPWVSVVLVDGTPVLGNLHGSRADRCFLEKLCQICGDKLDHPIVLFSPASSHAKDQTPEPPMHPECAAYSAKACPMVNGCMTHWRAAARAAGKPCPDPGCDCAGWVDADDGPEAGRPAEPWFAVWVAEYDVGVDPGTRRPNAAIYTRLKPLKVRPLTTERCPA